jgi:hypothetical protein
MDVRLDQGRCDQRTRGVNGLRRLLAGRDLDDSPRADADVPPNTLARAAYHSAANQQI